MAKGQLKSPTVALPARLHCSLTGDAKACNIVENKPVVFLWKQEASVIVVEGTLILAEVAIVERSVNQCGITCGAMSPADPQKLSIK